MDLLSEVAHLRDRLCLKAHMADKPSHAGIKSCHQPLLKGGRDMDIIRALNFSVTLFCSLIAIALMHRPEDARWLIFMLIIFSVLNLFLALAWP